MTIRLNMSRPPPPHTHTHWKKCVSRREVLIMSAVCNSCVRDWQTQLLKAYLCGTLVGVCVSAPNSCEQPLLGLLAFLVHAAVSRWAQWGVLMARLWHVHFPVSRATYMLLLFYFCHRGIIQLFRLMTLNASHFIHLSFFFFFNDHAARPVQHSFTESEERKLLASWCFHPALHVERMHYPFPWLFRHLHIQREGEHAFLLVWFFSFFILYFNDAE